jgi:hypothetical protein
MLANSKGLSRRQAAAPATVLSDILARTRVSAFSSAYSVTRRTSDDRRWTPLVSNWIGFVSLVKRTLGLFSPDQMRASIKLT